MKAVVASILVSFLLACGSSKVLDEKRARAIVSESSQSQSFQIIVPPPILGAMARSTDALKGSANGTVRSLIEAKFVAQNIEVVSYPRISGTFFGRKSGGSDTLTIDLQVVGGTNAITGSFTWGVRRGARQDTETGPVSGIVTPTGIVRLSTTANLRVFVDNDEFQYVENGSTATLLPTHPRGANWFDGGSWTLTGPVSPGRVEVKWYSYSFSPQLQIAPSVPSHSVKVIGGSYEVGEVSNLRLVTETQATANFAWQARLNKVPDILYGGQISSRPSGTGSAKFTKKPDGTWVLLDVVF